MVPIPISLVLFALGVGPFMIGVGGDGTPIPPFRAPGGSDRVETAGDGTPIPPLRAAAGPQIEVAGDGTPIPD
jgi:hypothetical protein